MTRPTTKEYYEAVRDCKPGDCGDCILKPQTNRACHMVDVDPRDEARLVLSLMDERDRYRAALQEIVSFDPTAALESPREYMTKMVWIADAALEPR